MLFCTFTNNKHKKKQKFKALEHQNNIKNIKVCQEKKKLIKI